MSALSATGATASWDKGALGPHLKSEDEHPQMVTGRILRVREEYFSVALTKELYLR